MREIKFRAWKMADKLMSLPFKPVAGSDYKMEFVDNAQKPHDIEWPDDVVYMQFTGLTDRNGTDIYEGDIVQSSGTYNYDVRWNTYDAHFCYGEEAYSLNDGSRIEVIGNIYENPELLK